MASVTLFASLELPSPSSSHIRSKGMTRERSRDAVYVASVPLRASWGPQQVLMSTAYSLGLWDLQHFMVVIQQPNLSQSKAVVFDFQPQDPDNVYVAVAALSGREVPGIILKRTVKRLPNNRCWFVGFSHSDAVEVADKFNEDWSTDLIVGKHDCRHYTEGLVQLLTGQRSVLDLLRATSTNEFML